MRATTLLVLLLSAAACKGDPENTGQVTSNNPPAIAALTLQPEAPYAADGVEALFETVDLDGDELSVGITWTLDGVELSADSPSLPGFTGVRDQVLAIEVTVSDGFSFGTPAEASVTFLNSAPVMDAVSIDPATPSLGDPLTCLTEDHDDDGDPLQRSLRWVIDGETQTQSGATLDEDLARNTAVYCEAWVSDGDLESERVSSPTVYIGNSPPGAPDIALDPDPPTACSGGSVLVTRDAYDPDGDPVSYIYAWLDAEGAEVCSAASCGGGVFAARATYTATVTAFDGFLYSAPAEAPFTTVEGGETFGNGVDDDCDGEVDEWVTAAWQAQGLWWHDTTGAEAGFALGVGDLDGDGLDDVALGANGSAEILLLMAGDAAPDTPAWPGPAHTLTGARNPSALAIGDVDGDGLGDLLVGAVGHDGGAGTDCGAVFLVMGDALADGSVEDLAAWRAEGDDAQERLGTALAMGDLNGDGYADGVIGEPLADAPGRESGEVYLFTNLRAASGSVEGPDAEVVLQGGGRGGLFGSSVAVLRDLDGDGVSELAVGAPEIDDGGADAGGLAIWYGGSISSGYRSEADLVVLGDTASGFLGREPASAGDVDGDGLADLVVGSEAWGSLALPGTLHLLLGADLTSGSVSVSAAHAVIEETTANAALGLYGSGAVLADTDGDGLHELIAGAGGAGQVYLWSAQVLAAGGALGPADAAIAVAAEDADDRYGRQVLAGDVDGDGDAELFATASRSGVRADDGGGVYVFSPPYGQAADPWSPDCDARDGRVFCRVPLSWSDARLRCQLMGLDLARLESSRANSAAGEAAAGLYPVGTSRGRWWIGLNDQVTEGSWVWLDESTPASFTAWGGSAPSGGVDAGCAALNSPEEAQWRDLSCQTELFFVCE